MDRTLLHTEETRKKLAQNAYGRKISDEQRAEMKELYTIGISQGELSEKFGIDRSQISRILNNKTTAKAKESAKTGRKGKRKLSIEQSEEIRNLYMTKKYSHKELAKQYKVNVKCIACILKENTEPNVSTEEEGRVAS